MSKKNEVDLKDLQRLIKQANQRLVRLERSFGKESWASKKLKERLEVKGLNGWTNSSRIRGVTSKKAQDLSNAQLRQIENAVKSFLKSKTSRVKGVKEVMKQTKKNIGASFDVSKEEAESIYGLFEDDTFTYFSRYIQPSDLVDSIKEARENRMTLKTFKQLLEDQYNLDFDINDITMLRKLQNLHNKYVVNNGLGLKS